jgi:hypothetical protein
MEVIQVSPERKIKRLLIIIVYLFVFLFFSLFYIFCRSNNFFEVDGPFRVFNVYNAKNLFLHPNNHLLFPINFRLWNDLLATFMGPANDVVDYGRRSQCLNSICMAISVANLFFCATRMTSSLWVQLFITFCFGTATAPMLHGTNCSEPVVGFMASTIAISLLLREKWANPLDFILCMLAGIAMALAMANYQTMVFVGPGCLALAFFGWRETKNNIYPLRAVFFLGGCVLGTIFFFLIPYWLDGTGGIGSCIARFFQKPGEGHVWGGVSISKIINTYPGFLSNQFLFPEWSGIRAFLRNKPDNWTIIWVAITVCASFPAIWIVFWELLRLTNEKMLEAIQILGMLIIPFLFLCYWDPTYNKMWIQPLWLSWLIAASGLTKSTRIIKWSVTAIFLPMMVLNMIWLPYRCQGEIKYLSEAKELLARFEEGDQIIADWNEVVIFATGLDPAKDIEFMPTLAITDPAGVEPKLAEMKNKADKNGNEMYFLGLLDVNKDQWEKFLGNKVGLPYGVLDSYRSRANRVGQLGGKYPLCIFRIDGKKSD